MKNSIAFLLLFIFSWVGVQAQDAFLQDENQSTDEKARVLMEDYQPELVMTGTQTRLFERKLGEFLIRAAEIKKMELSEKDRLHLLRQLSVQENEEMATILTRPQVKRYMQLKPELQPIAMIVDSVKNKKQ